MFVSLFNPGKLNNFILMLELFSWGPALMPAFYHTGICCHMESSFAEALLCFISIKWRMIAFRFEGRRFPEKPVLWGLISLQPGLRETRHAQLIFGCIRQAWWSNHNQTKNISNTNTHSSLSSQFLSWIMKYKYWWVFLSFCYLSDPLQGSANYRLSDWFCK